MVTQMVFLEKNMFFRHFCYFFWYFWDSPKFLKLWYTSFLHMGIVWVLSKIILVSRNRVPEAMAFMKIAKKNANVK